MQQNYFEIGIEGSQNEILNMLRSSVSHDKQSFCERATVYKIDEREYNETVNRNTEKL